MNGDFIASVTLLTLKFAMADFIGIKPSSWQGMMMRLSRSRIFVFSAYVEGQVCGYDFGDPKLGGHVVQRFNSVSRVAEHRENLMRRIAAFITTQKKSQLERDVPIRPVKAVHCKRRLKSRP
jgi:hypothetical protein